MNKINMRKTFLIERLDGGGFTLKSMGKTTAFTTKGEIEREIYDFLKQCFNRISHPNKLVEIVIEETDNPPQVN